MMMTVQLTEFAFLENVTFLVLIIVVKSLMTHVNGYNSPNKSNFSL